MGRRLNPPWVPSALSPKGWAAPSCSAASTRNGLFTLGRRSTGSAKTSPPTVGVQISKLAAQPDGKVVDGAHEVEAPPKTPERWQQRSMASVDTGVRLLPDAITS